MALGRDTSARGLSCRATATQVAPEFRVDNWNGGGLIWPKGPAGGTQRWQNEAACRIARDLVDGLQSPKSSSTLPSKLLGSDSYPGGPFFPLNTPALDGRTKFVLQRQLANLRAQHRTVHWWLMPVSNTSDTRSCSCFFQSVIWFG